MEEEGRRGGDAKGGWKKEKTKKLCDDPNSLREDLTSHAPSRHIPAPLGTCAGRLHLNLVLASPVPELVSPVRARVYASRPLGNSTYCTLSFLLLTRSLSFFLSFHFFLPSLPPSFPFSPIFPVSPQFFLSHTLRHSGTIYKNVKAKSII